MLKVDPHGKSEVRGRKWKVSKALCGEWLQLVATEHRVLVYYCATWFRELNLRTQRSTIVEHWVAKPKPNPCVKDV